VTVSLVQHSLFDAPILPGLATAEDCITAAEERDLIVRIDSVPLAPFRFQQWTGKRLTHSWGWTYDFATGGFAPADPIPDWLEPFQARAACFAGLEPGDLCQALVIRYDPGAGIGWHRDRPVFEHVVGISLGAPAVLRFRQREGARFRRATASLVPRGIYHMAGEARHLWEHSIAAMAEARWSVTFRSLAKR
jgi:alkylated DNA repair dioxygenase AlkB